MTIDLAKFQQQIEIRRQRLINATDSELDGTETVELDQTKVGRLSRMDALQMQQMHLASERRRIQELGRLELAMDRIRDGSYGECFECGENINPQRLEVDLTATFCIRCAQLREQKG
ncbi:MAG: TraR/DksA C4-type zinc finger protein [Pseudomonadota bacterium]